MSSSQKPSNQEKPPNHPITWSKTLLTSAILVLLTSIAWFLYEPSFEPLIMITGGITGLVIYKRTTNTIVDSAIAIFLFMLFVAGVITIVANQSANEPSSWLLVNRLITFITVLGTFMIVIQVLRWSLSNTNSNQIAKLVAWSLVGRSDENVIVMVLTNLGKLIASMITWSILVSIIWIIAVLAMTALGFALGSHVSGTWEVIRQYGIFGLVIGALTGAIISLYRFQRESSLDNT